MMRLTLLLTLAALPLAAAPADPPMRAPGSAGDLTMAARTVTAEDGTEVEVEAGTFLVPENRRRPGSAVVSIPFYRLPSIARQPAPPIFLLAGGPGSSWIDRMGDPENLEEVQLYRTIADVVLFDQRGGGHSLPELDCDEHHRLPLDEPLAPAAVEAALREMATRCRDRWIEAGVDLAGYTTEENAEDVLALSRALGYGKMSLVGGSYGSHLALALMRKAPEALHRVVLYGVEGPDHTWDDPSHLLAAYERIAGAAEVSEALGAEMPEGGLLDALRAALEDLEAQPRLAEVGEGDDRRQVLVDAHLLRRVAGFQAGRRSRPNVWPELLLDVSQGDFSLLAQGAVALRRLRLHSPMHYMMDCASGISRERAARLRRSPARELLGDVNLEYEAVCPVWNAPDLGPEFRAPVASDVSTLIVHGTWDTSTPIENAREVAAHLSRGHLVEVIGGTHGALYNLYSHWSPMKRKVAAFLRGDPVRFPSSVTLPPVKHAPRTAR